MAPEIASALILAGGGVLLAVCAVLVVRQLGAPALDRARLLSIEQLLPQEVARLERRIGEADKAAVDARRIAARRDRKRDREELAEEEQPPELPRAPVFKPGCDLFGRPVTLPGPREARGADDPAAALAARGFAVRNGNVEQR